MQLASIELTLIRVTPKTTYLFVELETADGVRGLGDASMSHDDAATAAYLRTLFDRHCAGRDVAEIGSLVEALREAAGSWPTVPLAAACSGMEQALWDLRGRQLGAPLHALLGGSRRDRVPLYANVNRGLVDRSVESFARRAREAVAAGFGTIKIAPFDGVEPAALREAKTQELIQVGVARIEAVREAIGPDVALRVDCHGRFDLETGVAVAERLRPVGLDWFEEPVRVAPSSGSGLSAEQELERVVELSNDLAPRSPFPLAGGEYLWGVAQFGRLIEGGAMDYVMPDVKYCGGVWELQRIAALADAYEVGFSPHNPGSPVATLFSAHVCAAAPNMDLLELQWGELPWRHEMLSPAEPVEFGTIAVPNGPGLGARLDRERVRSLEIPI
ncbi:MAG: mandelate racemase/muconate lactonizing enzyme family protein [Chloroflexota bacterium]